MFNQVYKIYHNSGPLCGVVAVLHKADAAASET